jgi:hypothetical protein
MTCLPMHKWPRAQMHLHKLSLHARTLSGPGFQDLDMCVAEFGSQDLGFRTSTFGSRDVGFRTSINGRRVSLPGPGFQDLDKRALGFTLWTWVSGPRKLSIVRSSYLFPVIFLCVHRHFSFSRHFSLRPVVTDGRTQQVTLYIRLV